MPNIPHHLMYLLEMMSKGGGKTSTLNIGVMSEVLEVIGWSVSPVTGVAKLSSDDQIKDNPSIKQWMTALGATIWGYSGSKEPKEFWFRTGDDAARGHSTFPIAIGGTPSTDIGVLTVQKVSKPFQDERGRQVIQTIGWSMGVPAYKFTSKSGSTMVITMTVDYYGRIADPNKTQIPSFWTWAYKNGLKEDAIGVLSVTTAEPKPSKPGARTLDDTGTCPACFRNMKLVNNRIIRHGWSLQGDRVRGGYSWHSGPCFGVGYDPWEVSPKGTIDYVATMEKAIPGIEGAITHFNSNPDTIASPFSSFGKPRAATVRGTLEYDDAKKYWINHRKAELYTINNVIKELKSKIAAWKQEPMYNRVASAWANCNK